MDFFFSFLFSQPINLDKVEIYNQRKKSVGYALLLQ